MKRFLSFLAAITVATLFAATPSSASQITYKPVNPNFGGNPFNGETLLNNATAQNQFSGSGGPDIDLPDLSDLDPDVVIDIEDPPGGTPGSGGGPPDSGS